MLSDMAIDTRTFKGQGVDALRVVDGSSNVFSDEDNRWIYAVEWPAGCTNEPPVCSSATASPVEPWPPNHKFVPISIAGVTDPDGDPITITATSIRQDESIAHAHRADELVTLLRGPHSRRIGSLLETEKHDIGDVLRESLEHEKSALAA
jgi:hypothetical protein